MKKDYLEHKSKEKKITFGSGEVRMFLQSQNMIREMNGFLIHAAHTTCVLINNDWFVTYKALDRGKVLLGNNKARKIVGVGTIKIKIFDGTMRMLTNVRHIPGLKNNLISLGMLDTNGYIYMNVVSLESQKVLLW